MRPQTTTTIPLFKTLCEIIFNGCMLLHSLDFYFYFSYFVLVFVKLAARKYLGSILIKPFSLNWFFNQLFYQKQVRFVIVRESSLEFIWKLRKQRAT